MAAKVIMVQGTMSNSGKTFVTAGFCRVFRQAGYKVAPFKAQNMALNSYITKEGLEIGRAQAMQAEAAMIEPTHYMNPVLLKPTSHMGSQVIVNGEVFANLSAQEYYEKKKGLKKDVMAAFSHLAKENDIIVIEGAGSPAEINLAKDDFVNMGMAKMADADVFLVADIDRGGVFASIYGTIKLMSKEDQDRIKGIIINKFRGDVSILKPGLKMIEDLVNIPVIGVLPMEKIDVDDEDSLSERLNQKTIQEGIDVAVIRLPHISNFTDFSVFELVDGVSLRYVTDKKELGEPDLILLPGTKNTMSDMCWLKESGLEGAIIRASAKTRIIGICGGFQLLGKELKDPYNVEHGGEMKGLGLLDIETIFEEAKTRTRIMGNILEDSNLYGLEKREVEGYEIHMGVTKNLGEAKPMIELSDGRIDGFRNETGSVWGSYLHGIFDNEALLFGIVHQIMRERGIDPLDNHLSVAEYKEIQYNKLADLIRENIDMDYVYELLEKQECLQKEKQESAEKSTEKKGYVHLYCGDGKGKTTCSMGLLIRAAGSGKKVLLHQFMKDNSSSERNIISGIPNITILPGEEKVCFTFSMTEEEKSIQKLKNDKMIEKISNMMKDYDMIVLDEVLYAITKGVLSEKIVLELLDNRPENVEVVLTGRNPSEAMIERADYMSEIKKIKHPFDEGVKSRVGIEK
ncbi:MAG: cobyric acid synthase [Lachnospiraceae bacterium]